MDRKNLATDFKIGNEVTSVGKLLGETPAAERESTHARTSLKTRVGKQTKIMPTLAGRKSMRGGNDPSSAAGDPAPRFRFAGSVALQNGKIKAINFLPNVKDEPRGGEAPALALASG